MEDLFSLAHAKEAGDKDVLLQRLQHSIAALEQTLDKPMHAVRMNAREKASYQDKRESIDLKIEASKQEVVAAKLTLVDAQAKRRRQEAYDELAAVALELPSREVSTTSITELKADLVRVQAETDALDSKVTVTSLSRMLRDWQLPACAPVPHLDSGPQVSCPLRWD